MLNWYRARFQHQLELDGNQNIHVPTLLIWGAKDHAFDRDLASSSIELCEKGELKFIEEAGHWVLHEEPERVNKLIQEFLMQDK